MGSFSQKNSGHGRRLEPETLRRLRRPAVTQFFGIYARHATRFKARTL